ncbi:uncharacterized protein LY89DRAFT_747712 [Mollisia scopiformis]|uniref:Uncharacterized protein n=1 Tax=Mollisia scopiformis TaxID=149040 RepID=A0A194XCC6_MOLSC|nr:uncharacterized protein LY89DRAFT_747712 [Mollisia scopiformis]KUJ17814.1 hypothetical protein LY89DRAFT_747712 [Mollisia scopiformis]
MWLPTRVRRPGVLVACAQRIMSGNRNNNWGCYPFLSWSSRVRRMSDFKQPPTANQDSLGDGKVLSQMHNAGGRLRLVKSWGGTSKIRLPKRPLIGDRSDAKGIVSEFLGLTCLELRAHIGPEYDRRRKLFPVTQKRKGLIWYPHHRGRDEGQS